MKKEQSDNLTEAQEAKIALQELADISIDKYVSEEKVKRSKQKNEKRPTKR